MVSDWIQLHHVTMFLFSFFNVILCVFLFFLQLFCFLCFVRFFFSLFFSTLWKSHNSWTGFVCGIPATPKFFLNFYHCCFCLSVLSLFSICTKGFVLLLLLFLVLSWGWVFVFVRFCCCWPGVCGGGVKDLKYTAFYLLLKEKQPQ